MTFDRAAFYASMRKSTLFDGMLSKRQVTGTDAILDAWDALGFDDLRWLAYALGTTYHETGRAMYPVPEGGKGKGHPYGKEINAAGQAAYGRGFVQITWAANYERADKELGLGGKLVADYDLALTPAVAAPILLRGMTEAWFTKFKLADYLNDHLADYLHARRIVNGMDQAEKIAGYALVFYAAIEAGEHKAADHTAPTAAAAPAPAAPAMPDLSSIPIFGDLVKTATDAAASAGAVLSGGSSPAAPAIPAGIPSATTGTATMTATSGTSVPVLSTGIDFLKGIIGKLETAHTMTTSGSQIATGVVSSLPEIPTVVGEISAIVVDAETGQFGLLPAAIVALVEEFEKIATKFGLDMTALDAFVRKLPFQPAVAKAA